MRRKLLSFLLMGTMAATAFAGCGFGGGKTSDSGSGDKGANTSAEDAHTLSVYAWDANFNIPALKAAEKAYQKKDKDFKLNVIEQTQSSDNEQAVTLAASSKKYDALPDIMLFQDHSIENFVNSYPDAWQDVNDAKINWNDFSQEKLSFSTIKDKHYGVPVDNGTVISAYRVDLLQQCGYTIKDLTGISWDRFIEIGEDVYNKTGKYLFSQNADGNDLPYMMMQAEGQSRFKDGKPNFVNNETLIKVMETIKKMQDHHVLYLANNWTDYTDQTIKGDMVAGVINGNWIIPTIEQVKDNSGKWEITTMPTLAGGKDGYAANGGSSLYITANCKKPDLAKDFLAYTFGGGEGSQETYDGALKDGGVITTCISAGKSSAYNDGVAYFNNQPIYSTIVGMGAKVPVVEQSRYEYEARTQIGTAIQQVSQGTDIKEALKTAEDQVNFTMQGGAK